MPFPAKLSWRSAELGASAPADCRPPAASAARGAPARMAAATDLAPSSPRALPLRSKPCDYRRPCGGRVSGTFAQVTLEPLPVGGLWIPQAYRRRACPSGRKRAAAVSAAAIALQQPSRETLNPKP